ASPMLGHRPVQPVQTLRSHASPMLGNRPVQPVQTLRSHASPMLGNRPVQPVHRLSSNAAPILRRAATYEPPIEVSGRVSPLLACDGLRLSGAFPVRRLSGAFPAASPPSPVLHATTTPTPRRSSHHGGSSIPAPRLGFGWAAPSPNTPSTGAPSVLRQRSDNTGLVSPGAAAPEANFRERLAGIRRLDSVSGSGSSSSSICQAPLSWERAASNQSSPTRSMKSPTLLYDPQPRRASGGSSSSTATRRELPSVANSPEAAAQVDASCAIGLSPLQRSNPPSTLRGDFGSASCSTSAGTYVAEENSIWSSAQSPELLDLRVAESEEQNLEVHHEEVPEDCRTAQPPRRPVARKGNLRPGLSRASSTQGRRDSVASDSTEAQNDLATQICAIQTIAELRGITLTFGDHPGCPTCASAGADIEYLQKQIVEKKERIVMCEEEKVPFDKAKEEASIAFLESAMKEISFRPCKEGQAKCRKARLEARHEMIDRGHTPDPQQPKRWAENARLPQLGTWMVWMVHRVFLNDPDLLVLDFACFALPAGEDEPRIVPKLLQALGRNTHLTELRLFNTALRLDEEQVQALADSISSNKVLSKLDVQANFLEMSELEVLFKALAFNASLQELKVNDQRSKLEGNWNSRLKEKAGIDMYKALAESFSQNTTLFSVDLEMVDCYTREPIVRSLVRNREVLRKERLAAKLAKMAATAARLQDREPI
ncbi:unnamed protein product, partial [Polarella glacialis]